MSHSHVAEPRQLEDAARLAVLILSGIALEITLTRRPSPPGTPPHRVGVLYTGGLRDFHRVVQNNVRFFDGFFGGRRHWQAFALVDTFGKRLTEAEQKALALLSPVLTRLVTDGPSDSARVCGIRGVCGLKQCSADSPPCATAWQWTNLRQRGSATASRESLIFQNFVQKERIGRLFQLVCEWERAAAGRQLQYFVRMRFDQAFDNQLASPAFFADLAPSFEREVAPVLACGFLVVRRAAATTPPAAQAPPPPQRPAAHHCLPCASSPRVSHPQLCARGVPATRQAPREFSWHGVNDRFALGERRAFASYAAIAEATLLNSSSECLQQPSWLSPKPGCTHTWHPVLSAAPALLA